MPSELATPAETPPAMSPDADLPRHSARGRWRDDPDPIDENRDDRMSSKLPVELRPVVSTSPAAFWRLARWMRIRRPRRATVGPWMQSLMFHCAAIIVLGLWMTQADRPSSNSQINLTVEEGLDFGAEELQADMSTVISSLTAGGDLTPLPVGRTQQKQIDVQLELPIDLLPSTQSENLPTTTSNDSFSSSDQEANWGAIISKGGSLKGRTSTARAKLADENGGTRQSEEAVERGLKWLAAHQRDDGSWRFHFDGLPCGNACRNPGTESTSTGSTALALLPFYGAGYSHHEGPYAEQVNKGLYYLRSRMLLVPQGGDLQEGTMYAQALATIVLCEAYAMSKDETLRPYAEKAVKFVLYAQDPRGGGWRYTPGMPGDTTMTGWQLMALKSARMAGIYVPSTSFHLTNKFLDGVQSERGAAYGYRTTIKRPSTSAVGLLCRMYLGWNRTHPAIREGVAFFDRLGPSPTDMYMNYYVTQLMFHHGSAPWERWNKKMRDYLIQTQATVGHENGSWHFDDPHGNAAGRLYSTAMAILTLEVYYRYLPLFSSRVVDEGF